MAPGAELWRERLDLADYVPSFAQRVLHVGCGRGGLGRLLKSRGIEVHGIEPNAQRAIRARAYLDSVVDSLAPETPLPFGEGYFDFIILNAAQFARAQLAVTLESFVPFLAPNGMLLLLAANSGYWKTSSPDCATPPELESAANAAGFGVYIRKSTIDPMVHHSSADGTGIVRVSGREFTAPTDQERAALFTVEFIWALVKRSYNPISHAHALFAEGRPASCFEILSLIPKEYLSDPMTAARVAADMQLCVLEVQCESPPEQTLALFATAQALFRDAVGAAPRLHQAYQNQAEFWRRIGDPEMGIRLLESIQTVEPTAEVANQITAMRAFSPRRLATEDRLASSAAIPAKRVLFITHERPNYGLDVLYDGLCEVIGAESVVDYPWKPSLHGHAPRVHAQYPCLFNRPGEPLTLDEILKQLREKRFDLILFGDIEQHLAQDDARRIVDAAGGIPVCVVDAQDEPQSYLESVSDFLGDASIVAYFKREYLMCHDYGPIAYPMPFAYPDSRVPTRSDELRPREVFWAGQRGFGLRRLYLEALEAHLGKRFDTRCTPEEYAHALSASRIGISFFGFGFDTVRYWELPAHGCMLLSERMPIRIPHNFVDGESAVFFDTTRDLIEKIDYYRAHPEEAQRIAAAGYAHLREFHTGSARARQILARISAVLDTGERPRDS